MLRTLLAATFLGALTLAVPASGTPGLPELTAKVTAGSISLTDNYYRFVVKDLSSGQNFHLIGPSVDKRTKVSAKVTRIWTVYLKPGTYTYRSDRRATMSRTFTVRPGPPPA